MANFIFSTKFCLISSLALIMLLAVVAATVVSRGPFNGESFSLTSRVLIITPAKRDYSSVQESYSVEQKRAKIRYETQGDSLPIKEKGVFYVDAEQNIVLKFDEFYNECKKSSLDDVYDHFAVRNPILFDRLPTSFGDEFVAGPARLLSIVANNMDEMKLLEGSYVIRNLRCFSYSISNTVEFKDSVELMVFYGADTIADKQRVPVRIVMTIFGAKRIAIRVTMVDYSRFQIIQENRPKTDQSSLSRNGQIVLDEFVFKLASGCSRAIQSVSEIDLFSDKQPATTRFSFKARFGFDVARPNGGKKTISMKSFVAYDARLDSMRYEIFETELSLRGPTSALKNMIFNFKSNRVYHALKRVADGNTTVDRILQLSQDYGYSGKTATAQCVVSRTNFGYPAPADKNRLADNGMSLGQLLAGADKFVYMGRGKVRGIEAKVYETSVGSLPYWVHQPVAYKTQDGTWKMRKPYEGAGPNQRIATNTILLYFGEREISRPLLMIEIYQQSSTTIQVFRKETIEVYDFAWELKESPTGDKVTELFSLADFCSEDVSVYAKVEMLLEGPGENMKQLEQQNDSLLSVGEARNLALLASLHESLRLPTTMIYDLESTLVIAPTISSPDANIRHAIEVSFNIAPHTERLADLVYIGQGGTKLDYKGKKACALVRNFQGCYYLAAHCWVDVTFGYEMNSNLCCIDLEVSKYNQSGGTNSLFSISPKGTMEIFRVENHSNLKHSVAMGWIRGLAPDPKEQLKFIGSKLNLRGINPSGGDLTFVIIHVQKEGGKGLSTMVTSDDIEKSSDLNYRDIRLVGFGLPESGPGNKRIMPTLLDANNWGPMSNELKNSYSASSSSMSYDQCHASCLADFDCQSFSVCIRNFEVECVTSNTSFRSPLALKHLAELAKESLLKRKGTTITVNLETTSAELSRHPNCELHHKDFLDLFKGPTYAHQSFTNRRVYPVSNQEECARMCTIRNLQVLRQGVNLLKNAYSKLSQERKEKLESQSAVNSRFDYHKQVMKKLCQMFYYVERQRLSGLFAINNQIQENLLDKDEVQDMRQIGGYCVIGQRENDEEIQELKGAQKFNENSVYQYIELDMYTFKDDIFYEKQYGVSLRKSRMELKVILAYFTNIAGHPAPNTYTDLHSFIEKGNNFQYQLYVNDESECAFNCFSQSLGPWPACLSFDIILETGEMGRANYKCVLNSITLHKAVANEKFELIENSHEKRMWHYEPRAGFAQDELSSSSDVSLAAQAAEQQEQHESFRIHSFGSSFIVLLGMISGILLSVWLGQHRLSSKTQQTNGRITDENVLIGPENTTMSATAATSTKFVNQVNSDGVIPD